MILLLWGIIAAGVVLLVYLCFRSGLSGPVPHVQQKVSHMAIKNFLSELDAYQDIHGSYPSERQGLSVLPPALPVEGASSRYSSNGITDPWGTPFRYSIIAGKPRIRSAGPDGQFETQDDIEN